MQEQHHPTSVEFDMDMSKLFLKARRSYVPGSDAYGKVLLLQVLPSPLSPCCQCDLILPCKQRLYQALVSDDPPAGPPYTSSTNFAALPAAPGTARPLHSGDAEGVPGVTMFRIATKDRRFVDKLEYKGWTIKLADWFHLSNCDDPSRPIIAQVFRCWISEEP